MASDSYTTSIYWDNLQINQQDVEFLHTHLFENETPLTIRELVSIFVNERVRAERQAEQARRLAGGKTYLPKEAYPVGENLVFPALDWKHGTVTASRAGQNPELGQFSVLTVQLEDGSERFFASGLPHHALNDRPATVEETGFDAETVLN